VFFQDKKKILTRIPVKRSDGAPMIFFMDVINSDFPNPILPMPLRIDMVTNGLPTNFIFPKKSTSIRIENEIYTYNYLNLFRFYLKNLIHYSKRTHLKVTFQNLKEDTIKRWWDLSRNLIGKIPTYSKDLEFILETYLKAFRSYKLSNDLPSALMEYTNKLVDYCNSRLESNAIELYYKQDLIGKRMYKIKKEHYFPEIFEYDVEEIVKGKKKIRRKAFIPIMLYDDLLECFLFNQMQLEKMINEKNEVKEEVEEEKIKDQDEKIHELISFDYLIENNIIIKYSKDEEESRLINSNEIIDNISFSDILKSKI
jgi:hypothetical protein